MVKIVCVSLGCLKSSFHVAMKTATLAAAAAAVVAATAYRNKKIELKNMGSHSDKFMNRTDRFETNPFMNEKPTFFCWLFVVVVFTKGLVWFDLVCRVCAIRDLLIWIMANNVYVRTIPCKTMQLYAVRGPQIIYLCWFLCSISLALKLAGLVYRFL